MKLGGGGGEHGPSTVYLNPPFWCGCLQLQSKQIHLTPKPPASKIHSHLRLGPITRNRQRNQGDRLGFGAWDLVCLRLSLKSAALTYRPTEAGFRVYGLGFRV